MRLDILLIPFFSWQQQNARKTKILVKEPYLFFNVERSGSCLEFPRESGILVQGPGNQCFHLRGDSLLYIAIFSWNEIQTLIETNRQTDTHSERESETARERQTAASQIIQYLDQSVQKKILKSDFSWLFLGLVCRGCYDCFSHSFSKRVLSQSELGRESRVGTILEIPDRTKNSAGILLDAPFAEASFKCLLLHSESRHFRKI